MAIGKLRNMTSVYLTRKEEMLLLYRIGSRVVEPCWCGIGGHFEPAEINDARACALRELYEEMGIRENSLEGFSLRYITLRLKNGEVRQNYYYFAELKEASEVLLDCPEGIPQWIPIGELLEREMPFSAWHMLSHYLQTGRNTDCLYGGITLENGMAFHELTEF